MIYVKLFKVIPQKVISSKKNHCAYFLAFMEEHQYTCQYPTMLSLQC